MKFLGYGGALPEAILQFAKKLAACQIENMKKLFPAVGVVLVALFAVSCAPKTPSYRISKRPEAYERLISDALEGITQNTVMAIARKPQV